MTLALAAVLLARVVVDLFAIDAVRDWFTVWCTGDYRPSDYALRCDNLDPIDQAFARTHHVDLPAAGVLLAVGLVGWVRKPAAWTVGIVVVAGYPLMGLVAWDFAVSVPGRLAFAATAVHPEVPVWHTATGIAVAGALMAVPIAVVSLWALALHQRRRSLAATRTDSAQREPSAT